MAHRASIIDSLIIRLRFLPEMFLIREFRVCIDVHHEKPQQCKLSNGGDYRIQRIVISSTLNPDIFIKQMLLLQKF